MRQLTITRALLAAAFFTTIVASAQNSTAFVHKATANSITSAKSIVDTSVLNGNSNLKLMVTHNYNPGGGNGSVVDKVLGFRFQSLKWYIIHQDNSAFNANTNYNVFIPGDDANSWSHVTTASNTFNNYTVIDDGRTNNNPNAKVFFANNLANYNNKVNGVFYSTSLSKWCIYNQAGANEDMEENLEFNIIVPKANTSYVSLIHTVDGNNTSNQWTYLNHPDLNNNPDALIFVTQVWNPGGTATGVYNNHNVGVQYKSNNKWCIYNEDAANMPLGASFNVMIFKNSVIGTEEFTINANQVRIQPNPATVGSGVEVVIGDVLTGNVEISVYDLTGKLVLTDKIEKDAAFQTYHLPTESLSRGLYVLKVSNGGKASAQKLILQ
jgi:hypothetical protein